MGGRGKRPAPVAAGASIDGHRWTLERVVAALQDLHASGEPVTYAYLVSTGHGALVSAAERYAGRFSRAVELAGIHPQPARPRWDADRVVDEIQRLHAEGVPMSCEQLARSGRAGVVSAARKYIGSWRQAIERAGVPRYHRGRWKSWDMIRERLQALHADGVRMSVSSLEALGLADLVAAARLEAGTWNQALARAGIPRVMEYQRWTADAVLDGIRRIAADGNPLSANLAERRLVHAAVRYFGSWTAACEAAVTGYRPLMQGWSVERVIGAIGARHRAGDSVRSTDVAKEDPSLVNAAWRLGLRWRDACRRAGVPAKELTPQRPSKRTRWNEALILAKLRAAAKAGEPLLVRNFRGGFVGAVHRRFGSWAEAMERAGLGERYEADKAAAIAARLGGAGVSGGRGKATRRKAKRGKGGGRR
jgi:hypothetical protein